MSPFDLFFKITGSIAFLLWLPNIIKYLLSFWYMSNARFHALIARRVFSLDDMKLIDEFLFQRKATFFRLSPKYSETEVIDCSNISGRAIADPADGSRYEGLVRIPNSREKAAIHRLVSLGYLFLDQPVLGTGNHVLDDKLRYSCAFITDQFRAIFHFWS
jgi:hypothetical protein